MARKGRVPPGLARYMAKKRRAKKARRTVRRRRNDWPGQPIRHTIAGLKGSFGRRRIRRSRRGGLLRAGVRRRRSRLARGFRHNPALQYMLPLMRNPHRRSRRKSKSSRRRNPVYRRRRSGYRSNPAFSIRGIQSQVMDMFSMDTLSTAGWGAAGAFGAMALPALPVVSRFNAGFVGYAMNLAATAVTATLAGLIPGGNGRRAQKVAAGGAIATLIRMGGDLFPKFMPMTLTARPLNIPGLSDATSDLARRIAGSAAYGMSDYRTGLEGMGDYRTGLEDWRTGLSGGSGMYGNQAENMATGLMH